MYEDIIDIKEIVMENNKTTKMCIPKKVRDNQDFFTGRPNKKAEGKKEENKDEGLENDTQQHNQDEKKEESENNTIMTIKTKRRMKNQKMWKNQKTIRKTRVKEK